MKKVEKEVQKEVEQPKVEQPKVEKEEELSLFTFPLQQRSIRAKTLQEALSKLNKK